jgi:hypothetical protein
MCQTHYTVLVVDDRHVAFYEYNGSVARIICVAVATLAKEKLLERPSDNDLLLCRRSTLNKTHYRQWFDRCTISKMILKSRLNWLFPVVFSVEITLSGSHSGNSFEFSHLTGFLNYALFCLFCLRLSKTSKLFDEKVKHGQVPRIYFILFWQRQRPHIAKKQQNHTNIECSVYLMFKVCCLSW